MAETQPRKTTKKEKILALFASGVHELGVLAARSGARTSYVSTILRQAGVEEGYFDLYTPTSAMMNIYSPLFAGRLGYKDVATARTSTAYLEEHYERFQQQGDRAGQHHTMTMALMMLNRARWSGKDAEAAIFRTWLIDKMLSEPNSPASGKMVHH